MYLAEQKDELLAEAKRNGKENELGAFFGVPVSIKDQFVEEQKGMTVGSTWMAAHFVGDRDCAIVAMLKREGAIPMVRGNLPQYCMAGHTDNHIFGRAKNPYDNDRTCGGSSGGDAGLVAAKCVPFAVGSDIGGSIRCPAACNGIIGFKPTAYRSTLDGMLFPSPGYGNDQSAIKSTAGPLCNSVADVKMYFESMW